MSHPQEEDEAMDVIHGLLLASNTAILYLIHRRCPPSTPPGQPATIGLHVSRSQGRVRAMPRIERPLHTIKDVEFTVLSINPRDEDNRPVTGRTYSWSVLEQTPDDPASTESVIDLAEYQPGDVAEGTPADFAKRAISGAPGLAKVLVVTVLADGSQLEEVQPIKVELGEPNALNLSAGAPVHE